MRETNLLAVLEGLLFISGDEGISLEEVKDILDISNQELKDILLQLQQSYQREERGLQLESFGNCLKLTTKKEHKDYYQKLTKIEESAVLSQAALEVLVIIAYNAPITRNQVDSIRGASSSHLIKKLLLREFIKEVGKSDSPGRPNLYGITTKFLDYFGLSSIEDLPPLQELEQVPETDLFETRYIESTEEIE